MKHCYTTEILDPGARGFIARVPGVREIERLFTEPSSVGRGNLCVEGGLTLVAGPGMGKSSLLRHLLHFMTTERQIPTALVALPSCQSYPGESGFYRYLAQLILQALPQWQRLPLLSTPRYAAVRAALAEPAWDVSGAALPEVTPRGLERWISRIGSAATHAGGICLLIDNVDEVCPASWKVGFVTALRFVFQASAGVTPIYAAWKLFADESLPGSNYFRNVTRPMFLAPLGEVPRADGGVGERQQLVALGLPELPAEALLRLSELAGGHPQLLHQLLSDLCAPLAPGRSASDLGPEMVEALLRGGAADRQRELVRRMLAGAADLATALREIDAARGTRRYSYQGLPKMLVASGLVDKDSEGWARVPQRVREAVTRE